MVCQFCRPVLHGVQFYRLLNLTGVVQFHLRCFQSRTNKTEPFNASRSHATAILVPPAAVASSETCTSKLCASAAPLGRSSTASGNSDASEAFAACSSAAYCRCISTSRACGTASKQLEDTGTQGRVALGLHTFYARRGGFVVIRVAHAAFSTLGWCHSRSGCWVYGFDEISGCIFCVFCRDS